MRLAEPKLAKRAKDGGARRDRTADLLHAMQALSQLSYGPNTCDALGGASRGKPRSHIRSDLKSLLSLTFFVARDVADDVGHVLIAFFFVGNEGRIIVFIVIDGVIDFDIVLGFQHGSLLAGILLGVSFLQRDQFFALGGFRSFRGGAIGAIGTTSPV